MAASEQPTSPSHPWISFQVDLNRASWDLWLMAGEAVSKCEHLAGVAMRPESAKEMMQVYLTKGAQATTAIEGNTLTEVEVRRRIEGNLQLPPSKEYLGIEIDNIVAVSNQIMDDFQRGQSPPLTVEKICLFNERVLRGLQLDEGIVGGQVRTYSVGVADYRGAPAADLNRLLVKLCEWLGKPWLEEVSCLREKDTRRLEAILKAILAHLYIAWIHPFGDGNGRTARLIEFYILVSAGVPGPAAHLLSNHYNQTRSDYYRQLSLASKSGGDVFPFCQYALIGFVDQLREQIQFVRDQQLELFWQQHLHTVLTESQTGRRRRHLVMDLTKAGHPVTRDKLLDISPRVARDYARLHERTLARDLEELESMQLIVNANGKYRARTETVLAYMPRVWDAP